MGDKGNEILEIGPKYLICFLINGKSGGRLGADLIKTISSNSTSYYGEVNTVFDIVEFSSMDENSEAFDKLRKAWFLDNGDLDSQDSKALQRYLVLAGGDGTVKWGVEILAKLNIDDDKLPKLGLIPLGTANELARVTGWKFNPKKFVLKDYVHQLIHGNDLLVDQWNVEYMSSDTVVPFERMKMICFASIGIDAKVVHQFQNVRDNHSNRANTVLKNKFWYFYYSLKRLFSKKRPLSTLVKVVCDGNEVPLKDAFQSLQIFNVSTAADGVYFWGKRKSSSGELKVYNNPSLCDKRLEISAIRNFIHMGLAKANATHSYRLAQCSSVDISLSEEIVKRKVVIQVDGEVWVLVPGTIKMYLDRQISIKQGPRKTFNVDSPEMPPLNEVLETKESDSGE